MKKALSINSGNYFFEFITVLVISMFPFYYLSIGNLGVYQALGFLQIFAVAVCLLGSKEIRIPWYAVWYALYILLIALSNFYQGNSVFQSIKIYSIALMAMFYIKGVRKPFNVYLLTSMISVCVGIYMLVNNELSFQGRLTITIGSIQQDPNWCALFFVIPFNYSLHSIRENSIIKKILSIVVLLLCVYITFLTGSRGAMLGLIVSLLIWVISWKKGIIQRIGIILIAGLFFLLLFWEFIPTDMIDRIFANEENNSRLTIWSNLIREYGNGNIIQMLFGRGDNSCHRILGMGAHNDLLEALFEFGMLGFVIRIVFWVYIIHDAIKTNNKIGVGILIALLTESMFSPIQSVIYFALQMSAVAYENKNKRPEAIKGVMITFGGGK